MKGDNIIHSVFCVFKNIKQLDYQSLRDHNDNKKCMVHRLFFYKKKYSLSTDHKNVRLNFTS